MRSAFVPDELRNRPFTALTAAEYGVTRSGLRGSQWRNLTQGVWAHVDLPDTMANRLAAVRLVLPEGAFICGPTSSWVYGTDVQDRRGGNVWYGCQTGRGLRARAGCVFREITVAADDLQCLDGVWITTPLRTAFDCGRWLSLVEGTVVADALAHDGAFTAAELAEYTRTHRALRGVRQVDRIIELMDARSESPMETRVRLLIVLAGLPEPEPQLVVNDLRGRFVARADFGWLGAKFILEYDGAFHWEQRRDDDRRRDALRALGWTVLVVSRDDYYDNPQSIVAKVRRALRDARLEQV